MIVTERKKITWLRSIIFCLLLLPALTKAQETLILINEVMARNTSTMMDETGNFEPYIELYNPTDNTYTFVENYLSNDPANLKKWKISNGSTLWGKRYKIIWCDGRNGTIHTNFKLNLDGDVLYLSNGAGKILDSVSMGKQYLNISYGRFPDGYDKWVTFATGTPGKTNNSKQGTRKLEDVLFSIKGGFYPKTTLTLSTPLYGRIYYTLDGSEPTEASKLYSMPISLDTTTVVRARSFADGKLPSDIVTQTYLIFSRPATLPVLSISTDPKYLFDKMIGIYVEGDNGITGNGSQIPVNWNMDWERPVNFEYYDLNKKQQLNFYCGAKINGGHSRMQPQKSLAFYFNEVYGMNKLDYSFFSNKKHMELNSLLLRNSGNDFPYSMMRDGYMQTLVGGKMNVDYLSYRPVMLFINGRYWGLENMREKPGDDFVTSNYGYDKDSIDVLWNNLIVENGSADHFSNMMNYIAANDVTKPDVYDYIKSQMDIEEYINYQITEIFVTNTDWPTNNLRYWHPQKVGGKWRWLLSDLDFGFGLNESPTKDMLSFATKAGGAGWPNADWSTYLFRTLLKNESFRQEFINKFTVYLGSVFRTERTRYILDSLTQNIATEIPYHVARWGQPYTSWSNNISIMQSFSRKRPEYMYINLAQFFGLGNPVDLELHSSLPGGSFIMNDIVIPDTVYTGSDFINSFLKVKPLPPSGYKFKNWEVHYLNHSQDYYFAEGSTWRYFADGNDLGTEWIKASFNDSTWKSGNGDFGFGIPYNQATKISPGSDPYNHYLTYYFRKKINIPDTTDLSEVSVELLVGDGAVVYFNEQEVLRVNMPPGPVSYSTLALIDQSNYFKTSPIDLKLVKPGDNIIAVEVHLFSPKAPVMGFDLALHKNKVGKAIPDTIILHEIFADTISQGMSLTAHYEPDTTLRNIVINEICASNKTQKDEYGSADDWIELYNPTNDTVDAGGLYITDTLANPTKHRIPVGYPEKTSIPPHGFLRLWADEQSYQGPLHLDFILDRMGEQTGLYQKNGSQIKLMDTISFGYQDYWYSFGRYSDGSNSWQYMPLTPGATNKPGFKEDSVQKEIVINEICANNTKFPDDKGNLNDWIELYNPTNDSVNIAGMLLTDDRSNNATVRIPYGYNQQTTIPPKGFLVLWCNQSNPPHPLHTDIKLSKQGEYIGLAQTIQGKLFIRDSFDFPTQYNGYSFGRYTDGLDTLCFLAPTPGSSNIRTDIDTWTDKLKDDDMRIYVYPNPTTEWLSIFCNTGGKKHLIISDVTGNIIMEKDFCENNLSINLANFTPALYIVFIQSEKGLENIKIIKQ